MYIAWSTCLFHIECMMYLNLLQINICLFSILKFVWTLLKSVLYIRMICRNYSRNVRGSIYYTLILWSLSNCLIARVLESLKYKIYVCLFYNWVTEWMSSWGSSGDFSICVNMLFFYHDDKFLANTSNDLIRLQQYIYLFLFRNFQNWFSKLLFISSTFSSSFILNAFKRSNSTWLS